ncbi:Rne/Rng family ribonuclease [Demequina sp. NBRC 110057]|uniref:Rne/Rng family ribonuclease n=1 Tax=Demequina sp. NBRC 110057 TaxID=1570346 RepID=UPI0009FCEC5D|nr:Rne/Rng family ribonuclease [Demequina sp. NBRC 110057]
MSEDSTTPENPTTAVIFQAPEPAKPRRASAPAGPPASSADRAKSAAGATTDDSGKAPAGDGAAKSAPKGRKPAAKKAKAAATTDGDAEAPAEKKPAAKGAKGGSRKNSKAAQTDAGDAPEQQPAAAESAGADDSSDSGDGDGEGGAAKRRRRRGGRGRGKKRTGGEDGAQDEAGEDEGDTSKPAAARADDASQEDSSQSDADSSSDSEGDDDSDGEGSSSSRRRRRRRGSRSGSSTGGSSSSGGSDDQLQGSTRLQAKRQRRRESRDGQRRRPVISEAEFLARRESVKRDMIVREKDHRVQIAVLEDDVLVEHYVSHQAQQSMAGNVYLGRVQNVLPGMEAAFVDVGRGRNAVLYAGEVNWDAAGLEGKPRRIELALKQGDTVMVQVTKDPIGHKGARVTSQISLAGRFLVYVPGGGVTGISRKLPDTERARLKKLLREVIPADAGVIVRTAAEGASEEELRADVERLKRQWDVIQAEAAGGKAPKLLRGEPDMAIRVVRDIFNEDFESLTIQGEDTWNSLSAYVGQVAPDLMPRLHKFVAEGDVFAEHRVDEMLTKGMDRKVWLPSGGSLVIDRTEAMTVIDVNTGKFVGKGGTLEETMTLNNLEAAEEIVRQLRLRDIGGIIVIDFVDMLLEANRDRVLRRLIECLGRDRTKHQVAEVTSLGLVQMTRKRVGQGLVEAFSETCEHCKGRGFLVHGEPVAEASEKQPEPRRRGGRGGNSSGGNNGNAGNNNSGNNGGGNRQQQGQQHQAPKKQQAEQHHDESHAHAAAQGETHALDDREEARAAVKATLASIAAAAEKAHHLDDEHEEHADATAAPEAPAEAVTPEAATDAEQTDASDAKDEAAAPAVEPTEGADEAGEKLVEEATEDEVRQD